MIVKLPLKRQVAMEKKCFLIWITINEGLWLTKFDWIRFTSSKFDDIEVYCVKSLLQLINFNFSNFIIILYKSSLRGTFQILLYFKAHACVIDLRHYISSINRCHKKSITNVTSVMRIFCEYVSDKWRNQSSVCSEFPYVENTKIWGIRFNNYLFLRYTI